MPSLNGMGPLQMETTMAVLGDGGRYPTEFTKLGATRVASMERSEGWYSVKRRGFFTLLLAVAAFGVWFSWSRSNPISAELRRDLRFPPECKLWVLENGRSERVLGVFELDNSFTLFAARRGWYASDDRWVIPSVVASGAPEGFAEDLIEDKLELDHFPTEIEIQRFRESSLTWLD